MLPIDGNLYHRWLRGPNSPSPPLLHLLVKGRESNSENHIAITTGCGSVSGMAVPFWRVASHSLMGRAPFVSFLSWLPICLCFQRSLGCSWDFGHLISYTCIYLAFLNPMQSYGYKFRQFQSFTHSPEEAKPRDRHTNCNKVIEPISLTLKTPNCEFRQKEYVFCTVQMGKAQNPRRNWTCVGGSTGI